jgi:hypothetical protein
MQYYIAENVLENRENQKNFEQNNKKYVELG